MTVAPQATTVAGPARIARQMPLDQRAPLRRMLKVLAAGVIILSLLAATALPSRADVRGEDLAKIIIGAVAIGAIVKSLDKGKAAAAPDAVEHRRDGWRHGRPVDRRPVVPSVCAIEIDGPRHGTTIYAERCLRRQGFDYRLPRDCGREVRFRGRWVQVFSDQCLRGAGFVVGHARDRDPRRGGYGD